ncbi:MAG: NIPSNAP family containing protein, partial [Bacteroidota bacterium]|nr:NIPSNAP family containing protein [Bacteroidota bacterium]
MKLHKQIILLLLIAMIIPTIYIAGQNKKGVEFYQIKVYHCKSNEQIDLTEQFLKTDLLPALHQLKFAKIGVFKPIENDTTTDKRIYIFIPSASIENFISLDEKIAEKTNLAAYADAAHNNPPYQRIETIILKAFKDHPHFIVPSLTGTTQEK